MEVFQFHRDVWPIIQRELREQARQRLTFGVRFMGALVPIMVLLGQLSDRSTRSAQNGSNLFGIINIFIASGLWLVGPILTADCLSQEKRDGTLNLLFLTPLRPLDIVLGKAFVHGWRALTFVIAALPVLAIPLLAGGVGWLDLVRLVLTQISTLAMALAAGLLASALSQGWVQARVMGALISLLSAITFIIIYVTGQALALWPKMPGFPNFESFATLWGWFWSYWWGRLGFSDGLGSFWFNVPGEGSFLWVKGAGGNTTVGKLWTMAGVFGVSLLVVRAMVALSARQVRSVWRSPPLPARIEILLRTLTRERLLGGWRRWRKGKVMDGNPARWLQSARWHQRVAWAGWLIVWVLLFPTWEESMSRVWALPLADLIFVAVAFSAASSYRRERGEGGLELLLVTPLGPRQLVRARFRAVCLQFVPIFLVFAGLDILMQRPIYSMHAWHREPIEVVLASTLCTAGWVLGGAAVGLALACTRMPFIASFLLTALMPRLSMATVVATLEVLGLTLNDGPTTLGQPDQILGSPTFHLLGLGVAGIVCFAGLWTAECALQNRWFLPRPIKRMELGN